MKIAIVLSAPPLRQVFRGDDPRAVSIVAERALWPMLVAGTPATMTVQCGNARQQAQLNTYFNDLIREETEYRAYERKVAEFRRNRNAPA